MTMEARVVSLQGILRQTLCGNVDIGLQSPKCDLQIGVDLRSVPSWCALLSTCSCVFIRVFLQFAHTIALLEDNRGNARDCAHLHGVGVRLYMCVCGQVFCCVLFLLSTVLRQISDCFRWARQLQSVRWNVSNRHILGCGLVELVDCTVLAGIDFGSRSLLVCFVLLLLNKGNLRLHVK